MTIVVRSLGESDADMVVATVVVVRALDLDDPVAEMETGVELLDGDAVGGEPLSVVEMEMFPCVTAAIFSDDFVAEMETGVKLLDGDVVDGETLSVVEIDTFPCVTAAICAVTVIMEVDVVVMTLAVFV